MTDLVFDITCKNCQSEWKVRPGPYFDEEDTKTYPSANFCPRCTPGEFDPEEEQ